MHGVLASPRFRVSSNETRATTLVFTSPPYDKHERDREQLARVFVLSIVSRPTRIRERFLSLFYIMWSRGDKFRVARNLAITGIKRRVMEEYPINPWTVDRGIMWWWLNITLKDLNLSRSIYLFIFLLFE